MKMKKRGFLRAAYGLAALSLAVAALVPGFRGNASAAQVTTRSIQMSSSNAGATNTTYLMTFTPATTATLKSIVIDFCDNTPIIGDSTCTAPTGFSVGTPTATTSISGTWTAAAANTSRTLTLTNSAGTSVPASTPVTITLTTATNPTTDNHSFYARILTYINSSGADSAATYAPGSEGNFTDYGGVAMSTGKVINVTARVMESLAFCVYKTACGDDPSLTLGHGTNSILDATTVDTGTAKFSISTNAQTGADVRWKGDTLKSGSNSIAAVNNAGTPGTITAGTANFGLAVTSGGLGSGMSAAAAYNGNGNSGASGTFNLVTANVTGTYGDLIATLAAPVNSSVTTVTFGATASNTTPAGIYTAAEQLIATGKF